MRPAPRPRQQQPVLIRRPEKTHPLHFPFADESKREPRACPKRPRPRNTTSRAGTIPEPCLGATMSPNSAIERILELSAEAQIKRRDAAEDSPAFHNLTGAIVAYGKALGLLSKLKEVQTKRYSNNWKLFQNLVLTSLNC